MSPEEQNEGAEEAIEDLEAPAAMQGDVAGGADACIEPTCLSGTKIKTNCEGETCVLTRSGCQNYTGTIVIREA